MSVDDHISDSPYMEGNDGDTMHAGFDDHPGDSFCPTREE
jgi:hypothetical protein